MQLARIADGIADVLDGQLCQLQKFCRFGHAVLDQEFLRAFAHCVPEDFAEVTSVQIAECRDIFHRDIILKILFDKGGGFLDIEVPQLSLWSCLRLEEERVR